MRKWRIVRNFASQNFRLAPGGKGFLPAIIQLM